MIQHLFYTNEHRKIHKPRSYNLIWQVFKVNLFFFFWFKANHSHFEAYKSSPITINSILINECAICVVPMNKSEWSSIKKTNLAGKKESWGGAVIGEQGIINEGLRSNRDAGHENPRSVWIPRSKASNPQGVGGGGIERKLLVERNGRESERRGSHCWKWIWGGWKSKAWRRRRKCAQNKRTVEVGVHVRVSVFVWDRYNALES